MSGRDCKTCDNSYDVDCPILREAKCYCKSGYVRDNSGNCVSPDQCQRGRFQVKKQNKITLEHFIFYRHLPWTSRT